MGLAHWDDVEAHHRAKGEMDATWQFLGRAAGTKGVGVNRVRVAPGKLPTPPHSHGASEELYYILGGSGLAWQDEQVHEVRPGDCVIHRADEHEHTFVAGPEGLEYLVCGTNFPTELGWLPRSNAIRLGWPWTEGRTDDPWDVEAQQPPLAYGDPAPRPANIVNVDEVEQETDGGLVTSPLATRERSDQAGLHWERIAPGDHGSGARTDPTSRHTGVNAADRCHRCLTRGWDAASERLTSWCQTPVRTAAPGPRTRPRRPRVRDLRRRPDLTEGQGLRAAVPCRRRPRARRSSGGTA